MKVNSMTEYYILDGDKPVPATCEEWEAFHEEPKLIAKTVLRSGDVDVEIVTQFEGIQEEGEEPRLFETWYYVDMDDEVQNAYSTWDEAEAGHGQAVAEWRAKFPGLIVSEDVHKQRPVEQPKRDQSSLALTD